MTAGPWVRPGRRLQQEQVKVQQQRQGPRGLEVGKVRSVWVGGDPRVLRLRHRMTPLLKKVERGGARAKATAKPIRGFFTAFRMTPVGGWRVVVDDDSGQRQEQRPRGSVVGKVRSVWVGGDPRGPSASPQDDTPSKEGGKSKGKNNSNSNGKSKSKSKCKSKSKSKSKCKSKSKSKCNCKCNCNSNSKNQCGDSSLRSE